MKVVNLKAPLLNYWVAKSLGLPPLADGRSDGSVSIMNAETGNIEPYQPSIDWSQGGPIVAEQWHELEGAMIEMHGPFWSYVQTVRDDPLLWFMRAFVTLRFGEEVEDPFISDNEA
jgi:hypothetical protein